MSDHGTNSKSGAANAQEFYTRWARLYDALATYGPGVATLRERTAAALDPRPGDTVVEMGCGTGANFAFLRERVGSSGTVVGVDFSPGMLAVARDRVAREGWENVHVVRADAATPPIRDSDAIVASFVSGMLADPAAVVNEWSELVGPGGRLALLDLARSTRPACRPLNALFHGLVFAGMPSKRPADLSAATDVLDRRVVAAQRALRERCADASYSTHALGFARLGAGTVD
ncbi:class I SAM-dependent methyltransferase [Haloprofundus salilacus]|uniref:class I SAM-dependent methyltransferase n=1 Tax=Haloprofundus salilacus TaxID=2876190 RepID=UPI001CCA0BAD|nr:methyltransferase domain-containing protein [Haloprofundus salilacus]